MPDLLFRISAFLNPIVRLACVLLLTIVADTAVAYPLTGRDLRVYGFVGAYRGQAKGMVGTWNGMDYDRTPVAEAARDRILVSTREFVYGPTGTNRFLMIRRSLSGNLRRVAIRCEYTGTAANSEYGEEMNGQGSKIISLVRRGRARPRLEMTTRDRFEERSVFDGTLFTYWAIRGTYRR